MATAPALLFPWSETYSVKIGIIDMQHKSLVDLINELHQAMITRTGKEHLQKTLSSLVKYTQAHFKAEEGILQANQYPELANQKTEHDRFIKKIIDFQSKFQRNEIGLTIDVMDFLKDWLSKHILGLDKQYSSYLNARGVR